MTSLLLLLPLITPAEPASVSRLLYVRPAGEGKWVPESEVTLERTKEGTRYVSKTTRAQETMTLTIRRDPAGRLRDARIENTKGETRRAASLEYRDGRAHLMRGEAREVIDAPPDAIVTTAPDWTDIFDLVPRYDARKGGKQEFAGVWFHPTQPTLRPTFSVEKTGSDPVRADGKEQTVTRYSVRLRGGSLYSVWSLADGTVCKILGAGGKGSPVVLKGYEEATRDLK